MDKSEIAKFSDLSSQWWDGNGFDALHRINPIRVEYILSHIKEEKRTGRLLDIGCGGGILCESMAQIGFSVTGIDPCEKGINAAKIHASTAGLNIDYHATDIESFIDSHESTYDIITLMEVVEHVEDFPQFLTNACKLLKSDGTLFISTLNRTLKSFLLGIVVAEYCLNMVPRGTHSWKKFIKPSEIDSILRSNGFIIHDIKGISYNVFRDEWHLDSNIGVNYILSAKKISTISV